MYIYIINWGPLPYHFNSGHLEAVSPPRKNMFIRLHVTFFSSIMYVYQVDKSRVLMKMGIQNSCLI